MKYAWITQLRDSFPVRIMGCALNVSPSGYDDSIDRQPSARAGRHASIQHAEDTPGRDFTADAPNRKWVTNITYLATTVAA